MGNQENETVLALPANEAKSIVGERLRVIRKARKLSRESVQESTGIHWDMLRRIEIGERDVEIGQLFALCELYGEHPPAVISVDYGVSCSA